MNNWSKIKIALQQLFNNTDSTAAVRKREIMESNTKAEGNKLLEYEQRKSKILASSEPVEGIFYIYRNQIIPDYKTEILESESLAFPAFNDDDFHSEMYHIYFYHNYMQKKFPPLKYTFDENAIPRGRVRLKPIPILYIDNCYIKNKAMISQLKKLYRLPANIIVMSAGYTCPACCTTGE